MRFLRAPLIGITLGLLIALLASCTPTPTPGGTTAPRATASFALVAPDSTTARVVTTFSVSDAGDPIDSIIVITQLGTFPAAFKRFPRTATADTTFFSPLLRGISQTGIVQLVAWRRKVHSDTTRVNFGPIERLDVLPTAPAASVSAGFKP